MMSAIEIVPPMPARVDDPEPRDRLRSFTGPERVLGIVPFVADVSTAPRWHHLLFTEDKFLAVPSFPEPAPQAASLFLPPPPTFAERYPSVHSALGLVAIPQPLTPGHVTAIVPYAVVRRARLTRGHADQDLPCLEIRAGLRTTWWFFRKDDDRGDAEKVCYTRDLLLALLPFPLELVGFSEAPRPPEWRLRRGVREPLPLLAVPAAPGPRTPAKGDVPSQRSG